MLWDLSSCASWSPQQATFLLSLPLVGPMLPSRAGVCYGFHPVSHPASP